MQIATAFKEQGISCGYVGLTTNTLFHRFFEHDGAHFPDRGRGIFMIARGPSKHMRSWEDWIVKYFTKKNVLSSQTQQLEVAQESPKTTQVG